MREPAGRSGRYRRDLPEGIDVCCGRVNRGFAVLGDRLFINTLDAHLLALDMKTGAVVWDSVIADYTQGYSATSAPLIVKDKVIVGIAGAEYGIRGFIDAFDAATGKLRVALLGGAGARREGQRDAGKATRGSAAADPRG